MPKISIITINLNNAEGLYSTIESVVRQSYKEYEYIIIDGLSTDGSLEIIKGFEEKISNWVSETDNGIYNAMNKGLKLATGEYCLFLNSGDYFSNDSVLQKVIEAKPVEDIVYGNLLMRQGDKLRIQEFPSYLTFGFMYNEFLGHASTFIKRKLFTEHGVYNEEYRIVSDWEFFLKVIFLKKCTTQYIAFPISVLVEGGISNNPKFMQLVKEERHKVLNTHFRRFIEDYVALNTFRNNTSFKRFKRLLKRTYRQLVNCIVSI